MLARTRRVTALRVVPLPRPAVDGRSCVAGGLAIAALDFAFCLAFGSPMGADAQRVLQGVAAGLLGRAAFAGGGTTATLGALCMVAIGCAFTLAYALAARQVQGLREHARRLGPVYGLLLYVVMLRVVVPLSAAPPPGGAPLAWALASVPMFVVFGTLAAVFAARSLRSR
jgi:hypothetical protein